MLPRLFRRLGPGLITGASDDDPSGIATYSQVGAQFGYAMLWTLLFSLPLMCAIQEISARIGRVTGKGIAGSLRRHYPAWILYAVVMLVFLANTINVGADIGAMGEAVTLLIGGRARLWIFFLGGLSLVLEIWIPYHNYVGYLKWLTGVLLSYVLASMVIHFPLADVLRGTFFPHFSKKGDFLASFIAILGTTISPYLFFWQASQEAEEVLVHRGEKPLLRAPAQAPLELRRIKQDTYTGMAFSNLVAWFIMLTTAGALHANGITDIQTSTEAAKALEPLAGRYAETLFAFGIIGTGLLALPVLAGSSAYGIGEALNWPVGLERRPRQAKGFYAILSAGIVIGIFLNSFHINPIRALFWTAVINGLVSVPVMAMMILLGSNPDVMGPFVLSKPFKLVGWSTTFIMAAAAVGLITTFIH